MNRLMKFFGVAALAVPILAPTTVDAARVLTKNASFTAISADQFNTSAVPGFSGDAYANWGVVTPQTPAFQSGLVWQGVDKDVDTGVGAQDSYGTIIFRNTETFGQETVRVRLDVDVAIDNGTPSSGKVMMEFLINQHLNGLPPSSCPSVWTGSYGCGDTIQIVNASATGDFDGKTIELDLPALNAVASAEESNMTFSADVRIVPIPAAVWLFGTGIAAVGAMTMRRRRAS